MTDKLTELLEQTPREIAPAKPLWPHVARQLKQQHHPQQWALAASLLLGILLGGIGGYRLNDQPMLQPELLNGVLQVIASQHQQRLAQLPSSNPLVPAADLQTLRSGTAELQQALQQQPNNQALLELWLWTQQRELELLQIPLPQHQSL
ncbi:hypothetical protein [uncultured Ferrimonas sp.]|uniref:hypothetical protein n=1 Tax=uncultured Ferrimonas sp. TaxID=432640 RepID=UPI0026123B37|nr:hypothetical protein [uncultured Ferrimonas sp.]